MKKHVLTLFTLILFAGLFTFNFTLKKKKSLQGAWTMVEGKWVTEDHQTLDSRGPSSVKHLKIFSENHFATLAQNVGEENAYNYNGGSYTFKDGIYSENLKISATQQIIGTTLHYKVRIEGDRFYMDACDENGNLIKTGAFEVWEKATVE